MLRPPAAERLIQRHLVRQIRLAYDNQLLLSCIQRTLGIQRCQIAVDPGAEANFSEAVRVGVGGYERLL